MQKMEAQKLQPEDSEESKLPEYTWMLKPCYFYKDEYSDCKSFKARFHQYFVHGKTSECGQWKEDYDNCYEYTKNGDINALNKLVDSEKARVKARLKAYYENDVWEHREEPPSSWNDELPESMKKEYKSSFLGQKAEELRSGEITLEEDITDHNSIFDFDTKSSCSIM